MNQKYFLNERWQPIAGYEGLYEISTYGRIRSLDYYRTGRVAILKLHARHNQYIKVRLVDLYGQAKIYRVHRLVALTFLNSPSSQQTQVGHKNSNKQDNRVENLEWCSPKGNMANEITRINLSIGHSNPPLETRIRMSQGQKARFARERKEHTGRYALPF